MYDISSQFMCWPQPISPVGEKDIIGQNSSAKPKNFSEGGRLACEVSENE